MLSPSEIRLGIVIVETYVRSYSRIDVVDEAYMPLLESLKRRGCLESNIQVKFVPYDFDIPLGVLFFAEYTDVDGVIVIGNGYDATIAKSLLDLQIQWNMPVEYHYEGSDTDRGRSVISMVLMQSMMADDVPEEQRLPVTVRRDNNVN